MRLLLDSHLFLWWLQASRRLSREARRAIASPTSEVMVSAASVWEIAIKVAIGKLKWRDAAGPGIDASIVASGFTELPVTARHAAAVRHLPPHHGDPFDRLLISQALAEGLRVVTADEVFGRYGVPTLAAGG
jgi:PIN domain nuclease of toxin-antitoxin system